MDTCVFGQQTVQPEISVESADPVSSALGKLRRWVEVRDYAGYEPYDILNGRRIPSWFHRRPLNWTLIQINKHLPSHLLRRFFAVPRSKNPKALGLFLSGYCDLARDGEDTRAYAFRLKEELKRWRCPEEPNFCWGYDWDYVSLRGSSMAAYSPNAVASVFCGQALLDMAEVFGDREAAKMASSVGTFFVSRLKRSVDTLQSLCFSYTPQNRTRIFNTSALVGAFLARLAKLEGNSEYQQLARRAMQYMSDQQRSDGSWTYGATRRQAWVDNFHTGYNLCALRDYEGASGDTSFTGTLDRGYNFYRQVMFTGDGAPRYYSDRTYPVDIHACAQALIIFSDFSTVQSDAQENGGKVLRWTLKKMQAPDGSFYYQRHCFRVNKLAYMRWGQAWMFHALARMKYRRGKTVISQ